MYNIKELTEEAVICNSPHSADDIRVIFPFDLSRDGTNKHCHGIVSVSDDSIHVIEDKSRVLMLPTLGIEEFAVVPGIGCRQIEVKYKDGTTRLLCRASELYAKLFTAAVGDMTRLAVRGESVNVREYPMGNACPVCGRPYSPGSDTCAKCAGKGSYVKRLIKLALPWKWMILLSVLLYFVASAVTLIPPELNRILVDDYIQAKNPALAGFIGVLVSLLAVNILNLVISAARSLLLVDAGAGFVTHLRQITFDKIQSLSISRIQARTAGELINRISSDCDTVNNFITNELGQMLQMVVTLVAVSVILFVYDARLALLVLCPVPLIIFINRFTRHVMFKLFHLSWVASTNASTVLHDTFSGIRVVKAFGMEEREIDRLQNVASRERDVHIRSESFAGTIMPLLGFLLGIGEFFIMYYVGNRILGGTMTFGEMSKFSSYVSIIYGPLNWISRIPNIISSTGTSVAKIFDILDEENEIRDSEDAVDVELDGEITFENVCFAYDITNPVIKDLTATVKKGEMIGIVGRSGVGKSTLINLVMRLYDPVSGAIKIDGHDIRSMSQQSLRSQIGVVLQENYLFSGTVFENIRYARPEATDEEIIAAAKLAGAHKFIVKLPDGYSTKVGERGYSLSGGERQRVAIARALLRDPKILILDEATSALDTETEKEVQDVLYRLTRNRTTLAIAHRLSTLRNADKILVLDRGRLAEFDSHDELMKKRGIYYELVMAQRQMSRMAPQKQS